MASATQTRQIIKTELETQLGSISSGGGGDGAGSGSTVSTGKTFFVHSGTGSTTGSGLDPSHPLTTIDAAVNKTTASKGDRIFVMEGHTETLTAAITMDVIGVSIIGLGSGTTRPQLNTATALDRVTVTAVNCTVEGLVFNEATAGTQTSCINVNADHATIRRCQFDLGANETDGAVTIEGGDFVTVTDCDFNITADGPGSGVNIEGASTNIVISQCVFRSVSSAASFDEGAVFENGSALFVTVENCKFVNMLTQVPPIDLTTVIEQPALINNAFVTLDVADNYSGPQTFYVNADTGNDVAGAGSSWNSTTATIDFAVGLCSADNGDRIFVAAGHAETLTSSVTLAVDVAGVEIIGMGQGAAVPVITLATDVAATVTVSAASCTMRNIIISNTIDNCTVAMTVSGADCTFEDFETKDTGSVEAVLVWLITGDRWHINRYVHRGEGSGDRAVACLEATGTADGILENFSIDAAGSTAVFSSLSTANTVMRIRDGYFTQREAAVGVAMSLLAADTGFIGPNIHIRLIDDNTDPFAAIDSASNVNFLGPITVAAGDDEPGLDISHGLAVESDQNLVQTPWGSARVIQKTFTLATSLVALFTPTVGRSLIVGLYGEVTTEIGAAADLRFAYDTTATDPILLTGLTVMDSTKVENWFGVTGLLTEDFLWGNVRCTRPFIVDGGASGATIGCTGTEVNSDTGVIQMYCLYIPLDRGALIAAV